MKKKGESNDDDDCGQCAGTLTATPAAGGVTRSEARPIFAPFYTDFVILILTLQITVRGHDNSPTGRGGCIINTHTGVP